LRIADNWKPKLFPLRRTRGADSEVDRIPVNGNDALSGNGKRRRRVSHPHVGNGGFNVLDVAAFEARTRVADECWWRQQEDGLIFGNRLDDCGKFFPDTGNPFVPDRERPMTSNSPRRPGLCGAELGKTGGNQAFTGKHSAYPALRTMSDGREDLQTSLWIARARSSRLKTVLGCAIPTPIPEAIGLDHPELKKPQLWFGSGQNFGSPILGHFKSADESICSEGTSLQLWFAHQ
jgi:hypothetical protein